MSGSIEATVNWLCALARDGIQPKDMTITLPKEAWLQFIAQADDVGRLNPVDSEVRFYGPCGIVRIRSAGGQR